MTRRYLQLVNAALAILTILLATMSILFGVNSPVYDPAEIPQIPALDSNLRFLGGLGLGIGLVLLWMTPKIEKHTLLFRSLWICTLFGGIGRAISMLVIGLPPTPLVIFTLIEVLLVPALILWQRKVSLICNDTGKKTLKDSLLQGQGSKPESKK
jgi:hypothetical protein